MNKAFTLTARIAELTAKGYTARAAERVAKRERKATHPLHIRAIERRIAIADTALAATGKVVAL
jgi:hypothetical protein